MLRLHFYGTLNRFLSAANKNRTFTHAPKGHPSIKDTIEAFGVPHTEVDCIVVNGRSVGFSYQLKGDENIRVYPDACGARLKTIKGLKPRIPVHPQFILDVHLGKLARYLRLLGFNAIYQKDFTDRQILIEGIRQKRIILTRDVGLLKNKSIRHGYFVRAIEPKKQIGEVVERYALRAKIRPFTLCLECNGRIRKVAKSRISHRLPVMTGKYYKMFFMCRLCRRIYWRGPHHHELARIIRSVLSVRTN